MVTRRLSNILAKHHILEGYNFCGLKEEFTSIPFHALNNIIEDTKEHKREL